VWSIWSYVAIKRLGWGEIATTHPINNTSQHSYKLLTKPYFRHIFKTYINRRSWPKKAAFLGWNVLFRFSEAYPETTNA